MKAEKYDPKRQRKMTYLTVILVVLAGMLSSFLRKDSAFEGYLSFHAEGYITLTDAEGNTVDVYYQDILSAEYVEAPDFGQPDGGSILEEELRLGIWQSDAFGTYWNCTQTDLETCVFIQTASGAYAISYESDETTKQLQGAILSARERLLAKEEPQ